MPRFRGLGRRSPAAGATLLLALAGAASAGAGVTKVSGTTPFPASCSNESSQPGTNYPATELEPWFDVNPTNSDNRVGIYQQDRWSSGGARGLATAVTTNGGKKWETVVLPKVSLCSGGIYDRATDPWLSFAPNGELYAMSLSLSGDLTRSAMLVSKSTDGGLTWGDPTTLIDQTSVFTLNDKNSLTADPRNANYVYAVWDRSRFLSDNADFQALHSFAFRSDIIFTRTTNAGASWEEPRAIFHPRSNEFTIGNQIVVRPNGDLVDIFEHIKGSGVNAPGYFVSVIRSTDKGVTWTNPITVSTQRSLDVRDPDTGADVRTGEGIPEIAVDRSNGNLYAVWDDGRFSGGAYDSIAFSMSANGGLTWTAPIKVNKTPTVLPAGNQQAFTPSVHVADSGTVGVTYYDFRNNDSAPGLPTDYWLVRCRSACTNPANWSEVHIAGPFNEENAPVARGFFVGDYEGLASVGNTFLPFFAQAGSTKASTDVYAATVGP